MLDWQTINGKESANELWSVSAEDPVAEMTFSHHSDGEDIEEAGTYRGRIFFKWIRMFVPYPRLKLLGS